MKLNEDHRSNKICVSLNFIEIIINGAVALFNYVQLAQELLCPLWSLFSWIYNTIGHRAGHGRVFLPLLLWKQ